MLRSGSTASSVPSGRPSSGIMHLLHNYDQRKQDNVLHGTAVVVQLDIGGLT